MHQGIINLSMSFYPIVYCCVAIYFLRLSVSLSAAFVFNGGTGRTLFVNAELSIPTQQISKELLALFVKEFDFLFAFLRSQYLAVKINREIVQVSPRLTVAAIIVILRVGYISSVDLVISLVSKGLNTSKSEDSKEVGIVAESVVRTEGSEITTLGNVPFEPLMMKLSAAVTTTIEAGSTGVSGRRSLVGVAMMFKREGTNKKKNHHIIISKLDRRPDSVFDQRARRSTPFCSSHTA